MNAPTDGGAPGQLSPAAVARLRTTATLVALALVLVLGVTWAWGAATEPFPENISTDTGPCTDVSIVAGQRLVPATVTVSVLNAGNREGLAGETLQAFSAAGFGRGEQGNAPSDASVKRAEIWASDPDDPAVQLVRSYLGKNTEVVANESTRPGITVVVGNRFVGLESGKKSLRAGQDAVVCSPNDTVPQ